MPFEVIAYNNAGQLIDLSGLRLSETIAYSAISALSDSRFGSHAEFAAVFYEKAFSDGLVLRGSGLRLAKEEFKAIFGLLKGDNDIEVGPASTEALRLLIELLEYAESINGSLEIA
jgi:hypothetical protein